MPTPKQLVLDLLTRLPDDVTLKDIQYHVYVLERMEDGLASADAGPNLSQEEVEAEFERWLDERIDWSA